MAYAIGSCSWRMQLAGVPSLLENCRVIGALWRCTMLDVGTPGLIAALFTRLGERQCRADGETPDRETVTKRDLLAFNIQTSPPQ